MKTQASIEAQDARQSSAPRTAVIAQQATDDAAFIDNRPIAAAQRKLAEMANSSPRVQQHKALSDMVTNSPHATAQRAGVEINDDPGLEAEADAMGSRALQMQAVPPDGTRTAATEQTASAVRPVVQGYFVHKPSAVGSGTKFESQNIRRDKYSAAYETSSGESMQVRATAMTDSGPATVEETGLDLTTSVRDGRADSNEFKALPDLKISDGLKMAINGEGQAKEFFAVPGVISESNEILASRRASVRLQQGENGLKVPGGGTPLIRVVPAREVPRDLAHPDGLEQITQLGNHLCNEVIKSVLGSSQRVVALAQPTALGIDTRQELRSGLAEPVGQIAGYVANTQTADVNMRDVPAHQEEDSAGKDYLDLDDADKSARAKKLGINEFAAPKVGEGYVTRSLGSQKLSEGMAARMNLADYKDAVEELRQVDQTIDVAKQDTDSKIMGMRRIWGEHYAGVVARDGSDSVTLENYNRNTEHEWEMARIFNNLFADFKEFRDLVATQVADLPAELRGPEAEDLIAKAFAAAQEKAGELSAEYQRAVKQAQKSVTTGLALDHDLAVQMIHFQMYGAKKGQSFHEQFAGVTANSVTLRVEESVSAGKAEQTKRLNETALRLAANIDQYLITDNRDTKVLADDIKNRVLDKYQLYAQVIGAAGNNAELMRQAALVRADSDVQIPALMLTLYGDVYFKLKNVRPAAAKKSALELIVDQDLALAETPGMRMLKTLMTRIYV